MHGRLLVVIVAVLCVNRVYAEHDSCKFKRGDANNDDTVNLSDAAFIYSGYDPPHDDAADSNDDGAVTDDDGDCILAWYFYNNCTIPDPGPMTEGCDCTVDQLEPCCSPTTTADLSGTVYTSGASHSAVGEFSEFDDNEHNSDDGEEQQVDLRSENDSSCNHDETYTFWSVWWSLDSGVSVSGDAFADGCVRVSADVDFAAEFIHTSNCGCPQGKINNLEVYAGDDIVFSFSNGTSTSDEVNDAFFGARLYENYDLSGSCKVNEREPYVYTDTGSGSLNQVGFTGDDCWEITQVTFGDYDDSFYYHFSRNDQENPDPDIATVEGIVEKQPEEYSIRLSKLEYDWCP